MTGTSGNARETDCAVALRTSHQLYTVPNYVHVCSGMFQMKGGAQVRQCFRYFGEVTIICASIYCNSE